MPDTAVSVPYISRLCSRTHPLPWNPFNLYFIWICKFCTCFIYSSYTVKLSPEPNEQSENKTKRCDWSSVLVACVEHIVACGIQTNNKRQMIFARPKRRGKQRHKNARKSNFRSTDNYNERWKWTVRPMSMAFRHFVLLGILTHIQDLASHLSNDHRVAIWGCLGQSEWPLFPSLAWIHFKIAFLSIKFRFPFYAHDSRWNGWFSARNSSHTLCVRVWFLWYLIRLHRMWAKMNS